MRICGRQNSFRYIQENGAEKIQVVVSARDVPTKFLGGTRRGRWLR